MSEAMTARTTAEIVTDLRDRARRLARSHWRPPPAKRWKYYDEGAT